MANTRYQAAGGGDARRQVQELLRRVERLERQSTLRGASISGGQPLRVKDGGSVLIEAPGNLQIIDQDGNVLFDAAKSTTVTEAKHAGGVHSMTANGQFHISPPARVKFDVPAGFDRLAVQVQGQVGHSVNGSGNSWIGCTVDFAFYNAAGNVIASPEASEVSAGFTPFHGGGGPATAVGFGMLTTNVPVGAVELECVAGYALSLGGQTQGGGDANSFVAAMCVFGHA